MIVLHPRLLHFEMWCASFDNETLLIKLIQILLVVHRCRYNSQILNAAAFKHKFDNYSMVCYIDFLFDHCAFQMLLDPLGSQTLRTKQSVVEIG